MAFGISKIFIIILLISLLVVVYIVLSNSIVNRDEISRTNDESEDELKEKIGQMLLVGFRGTEANTNSYIAKVLKEVKIGGVILFDFDVSSKSFPRNIVNPEQTKKLISDLKNIASTPIFVAVDVEGGKVNRLKEEYGFISVPSAAQMGEINNLKETKKVAESVSHQLSELGFNVNFAPVVDLNVNPENPIIGAMNRAFSNDPQKVILHAQAFIEGLNENNIISAIKHFPGHGSSASDSHLDLVDVTKTYKREELIPYKELVKLGIVDMVMTAHIINKNIDSDYPATLSSNFLQNILRKEVEFQGVIVSDDMHMGAVTKNFGFEEAIIQAVNAGCNILIISNNGEKYDEQAPYKARDIIFEAVKNGLIEKEKIDESFQKIMDLKKKYGIVN